MSPGKSIGFEIKSKIATRKFYMQSDQVRKLEIPSANFNASARGLAMLGAYMANKGQLCGKRLISEETCELLHSD